MVLGMPQSPFPTEGIERAWPKVQPDNEGRREYFVQIRIYKHFSMVLQVLEMSTYSFRSRLVTSEYDGFWTFIAMLRILSLG